MKPLVVISDPHFYRGDVRIGAHQYAEVFARRGWEVYYVTADFSLPRILGRSKQAAKIRSAWRSTWRGTLDGPVRNFIFAHVLPRSLRLAAPPSLASRCFVPVPRRLLKRAGRKWVDLLWLHGNDDYLHRHAWPHRKCIVRLFDHYEHRDAMRRRRTLELLKDADAVFACSEDVASDYADLGKRITVVPNGVDFAHFANYRGPCPSWLAPIKPPRILYIGAIAEWFDWELIHTLAKWRPQYSFVLVGPVTNSPASGTCPANVRIIGPKPYHELPAIAAHAACGIVPFRASKLVEGVSPIKVYEYLAAGLPTVSTYWRELERQALPIGLARSHSEFVLLLDAAMATSVNERTRLRQCIEACSWDHRLDTLMAVTELSVRSKDQ